MKPKIPRSTPRAALDEIDRLTHRIALLTAERDALLSGVLVPAHEKPGRFAVSRYDGAPPVQALVPFLDGVRLAFLNAAGDAEPAIEITDGTDEVYPRRPAILIRGCGAINTPIIVTPRASNTIIVEADLR